MENFINNYQEQFGFFMNVLELSIFLTKRFKGLYLQHLKRKESQQIKLEIISAMYGARKIYINVTDIVKERIDNDLIIEATNELAGDPYPNTKKC